MKYMSRFVQYYRENAKYLERTYGFVERIGIDKLRAIIVEDSEGIGSQLEANLQRSTEAYTDPWKAALTSTVPNEFSTLLNVIQ
jgi:nitrite reductase (NADH) large subunit